MFWTGGFEMTKFGNKIKMRVRAFAVFFHIFLLTFPHLVYADSAQDQFRQQNDQQAAQFLKAAKIADKAADTNDLLWKVWAGVGVVCIATCAASLGSSELFGPAATPYVCPGVTVAASVTDAVMTKEFTSAIMGIAGAGASLALAPDKPEPKIGPNGKEIAGKPAKNWGACLSGAMATIQVFIKRQAMEDARQSAKQNRKIADQFLNAKNSALAVNAAPPAIFPSKSAAAAAGGDGTSASSSGAGGSLSGNTAALSNEGLSKICSQSGSGAGQAIQCAVSQDPTLPDGVNSPRFAKNFKKASGIEFGAFLEKKSGSAGGAIQGAIGGALSPGKAAELGALVAQYESRFHALGGAEGSSYAGGGGGGQRANSAPSEELNPQAIVEGLLAQFIPKDEAQGVASLDSIEKANRFRTPASIMEDSKMNLFDRVSYRYQTVTRRIMSW
jgi:hypothetical protein